jgi:hypothetical protein
MPRIVLENSAVHGGVYMPRHFQLSKDHLTARVSQSDYCPNNEEFLVDFHKCFNSKSVTAALKKLSAILLVILLLPALWFFLVRKNPDNPLFNPALFRFENYTSHQDMVDAVRHMFPIGTDKAYVEKSLSNRRAHGSRSIPGRKTPIATAKRRSIRSTRTMSAHGISVLNLTKMTA